MSTEQDIRTRAQHNLLVGLGMLLFAIVFYVFTYHFPSNELERVRGDVGPGFFPRLFLAALAAESLFLILTSTVKITKYKEYEKQKVKLFQGLPFIMLALFILYIVLCFLIGYIPATIIYMCLTFYILGVRSIWQLAIISPAITMATYYLFQGLLDVYLPTGILF